MEFCWILDFANLLHLFCLLPFLCIASYTHDMLDDQCSQSYWMEFLQLLIILVQPIGSSQFLIASSRYICLLRLALTLPCISVHTGVLVRCTRCLSMNTQRIKIKLDFQNLLRPSCALTIDDYKNEGDVLHCYQMKSKSGHANKNGPLITIIKTVTESFELTSQSLDRQSFVSSSDQNSSIMSVPILLRSCAIPTHQLMNQFLQTRDVMRLRF
ncbi:uncharacterized protein LOC108223826 isoform X2 [Daucus carota subsp. sativus]|uniref:uncharacterized protein LOC108223826 isoform X2 n=1 Tax=Daucus carota subsp. sativus TaxID=79200 RepID=UPI00308293FC